MSPTQPQPDNSRAAMKERHNAATGAVLRALRTNSSMSQETLAYDSGVDRTHISLIELGRRSPTVDTVLRLCGGLNVKFTYFARLVEEALENGK